MLHQCSVKRTATYQIGGTASGPRHGGCDSRIVRGLTKGFQETPAREMGNRLGGQAEIAAAPQLHGPLLDTSRPSLIRENSTVHQAHFGSHILLVDFLPK
jgi:hypothetical protein